MTNKVIVEEYWLRTASANGLKVDRHVEMDKIRPFPDGCCEGRIWSLLDELNILQG
jgi:hypothetical protein